MTARASRRLIILIAMGALTLGRADVGSAQTQHHGHKTQPVARQKTAPDVTATIPAPAPQADDETLPPPFNFPPTTRTRMHACGQKWQTVKMSGLAADQTWREFATRCLTQPDEPETASP